MCMCVNKPFNLLALAAYLVGLHVCKATANVAWDTPNFWWQLDFVDPALHGLKFGRREISFRGDRKSVV